MVTDVLKNWLGLAFVELKRYVRRLDLSGLKIPSGSAQRLSLPLEYRKGLRISFVLLLGGAISALVLSAAGHREGANIQYFCTSVGSLGILFACAWATHRRDRNAVDIIVASETIISFGIGSLVFGLVEGIAHFINEPLRLTEAPNFDALALYLWPFAIGLFTAALGPMFAVILRNIDAFSQANGSAGSVVDGSDLSATASELSRLVGEIRVATDSMSGLSKTFMATGKEWHDAWTEINRQMKDFASAIHTRTSEIDSEISSFKNALAGGRDSIVAMSEQIATSGERFGAATERAGAAMKDLTSHTDAFKQKLQEGTRLLEGLEKIIASVQRFIKPDEGS